MYDLFGTNLLRKIGCNITSLLNLKAWNLKIFGILRVKGDRV
jgi:hypothetical protein